MSLAMILISSWLAIAALAMLALTLLAARRGEGEAELGILGDAELRTLLGSASARATARLLGAGPHGAPERFGQSSSGVDECGTLDAGGVA